MGKSDNILYSSFYNIIKPFKETALLGFTNNDRFDGDLYDRSLGNWDINNKDWNFKTRYQTMICLRCAYFCNDLPTFFKNCYDNMYDKGCLYVDFGLGDHWRFDDYKVGWVKNGEHEWAYSKDNKLYSCFWNDNLLKNFELKKFEEYIKPFGYNSLKQAIHDEVPHLINIDIIREYFKSVKVYVKTLWPERPQLYILLSCQRDH